MTFCVWTLSTPAWPKTLIMSLETLSRGDVLHQGQPSAMFWKLVLTLQLLRGHFYPLPQQHFKQLLFFFFFSFVPCFSLYNKVVISLTRQGIGHDSYLKCGVNIALSHTSLCFLNLLLKKKKSKMFKNDPLVVRVLNTDRALSLSTACHLYRHSDVDSCV